MNKFTGLVRRCVDDYSMIEEGDRIAVGLSGGKDSMSLLCALNNMRSYYPKKYDLIAISLDMGFEGVDFSPVEKFCEDMGVPFVPVKTQIKQIVFDDREEKNPCSLCAKLRRGILNTSAVNQSCNKVALGHHYDDAVETFMMSLFYEGRISCFLPVTYLSRREVTQIRPLLYIGEATIKSFAERYSLPVVHNPCPKDKDSVRQEVKELLKSLGDQYPDLKAKVFGAMQRLPLKGWEPKEYARRPLPDF